jgi:(p)ppGpp synthase/HD superfamily hydrolase
MVKLKHMDAITLREAIRESGDWVQLERACDLATVLHDGQTRKEPVQGREETPYIEHCLRNVLRLIRYGVTDEDVLIGAAFHDVVEDCMDEWMALRDQSMSAEDAREAMFAELEADYGARVKHLVASVTNPIEDKSWKKQSDDVKFAEDYL